MITISTGIFSLIDGADAFVRAKISQDSDFFSKFVVRINFIGLVTFSLSMAKEIKYFLFDICNREKKINNALDTVDEKESLAYDFDFDDEE